MIKLVANLDEAEYLSIPNRRSVINEFWRYEFLQVDRRDDRKVISISMDIYDLVSSRRGLELASGLKTKQANQHQLEVLIAEQSYTLSYFHNKADQALESNPQAIKFIFDEFFKKLTKEGWVGEMVDLIDAIFYNNIKGETYTFIEQRFTELEHTENPLLEYPPTFTVFEILQKHVNFDLATTFKNVLLSHQKLNNTFTMIGNSQPALF